MSQVIKGKVQKIDKIANIVNYTPARAVTTVYDRYIFFLELNDKRYFFLDKKLRTSTKPGHEIELVADADDNILAWKNKDANTHSVFNMLHILFSANNIVAVGIFLSALYVGRFKTDWLPKIWLVGIPLLVAVFIYSFFRGMKKMKAQQLIMEEQ